MIQLIEKRPSQAPKPRYHPRSLPNSGRYMQGRTSDRRSVGVISGVKKAWDEGLVERRTGGTQLTLARNTGTDLCSSIQRGTEGSFFHFFRTRYMSSRPSEHVSLN
jgi:hypothetical protein